MATIQVISWAIIDSGLRPLDRYGAHQESISRRPEQMYTPSDTRLEWLGEGPLFESDSNKRWRAKCSHYLSQAWAIIEARPGAFVQIWNPPDHKCET